jgi:hypothetical protein
MINPPIIVNQDCFQQTWLKAVRLLMGSQWEVRNLVAHIGNPALLDKALHAKVSDFAQKEELLGPRHVAYTIFPHDFCRHRRTTREVFDGYNRPRGLYERLHRRAPGWGTYFRRMTRYEGRKKTVNQLENIIDALKARKTTSKAAYTIVIQHPGGETVRPLGGPCLNYVAVQLEPGPRRKLGLLAVYRNHDFLERAYGNYWGLCNLLCFLASEVGAVPGPLTCVSSHAYVPAKKTALKAFVEAL